MCFLPIICPDMSVQPGSEIPFDPGGDYTDYDKGAAPSYCGRYVGPSALCNDIFQ